MKNLPAHSSLKRPTFQSLVKKMVYSVSKEIGSKTCFAVVFMVCFLFHVCVSACEEGVGNWSGRWL